MFHSIPIVSDLCRQFLVVVLIILAIMFLLCLVRLILGPSVADRLLATNMLGGIVLCAIVLLSLVLEESYLLDIGIIYALISFLSVVVLTQIYIGVYRARHEKRACHEKKEKGECPDEHD